MTGYTKALTLIILCLSSAWPLFAHKRPGEWGGDYLPCDRHGDILSWDHMNLGVRFATANPELAVEFARALNFWTTVLDMNWHHANDRSCSVQIVDGDRGLFHPGQAARAQFPSRPAFQGWIAFNPEVSLTRGDQYQTAVHELGHLLGLPHSPNASSIMYFLLLSGPASLDAADLAALAIRHKLRVRNVDTPLIVTEPLGPWIASVGKRNKNLAARLLINESLQ